MSKDLVSVWTQKALLDEKITLSRASETYEAMVDKESDYAKAVNYIIETQRKVVDIWEEAYQQVNTDKDN